MPQAPGADPTSVFLNVPYDARYEPYFVTLVSTLVCLGQTPRCVAEIPERGSGRLGRIFDLLRSCHTSIHDLCRTGRFNMPFELGLACALGLQEKGHEIVVLDTQKYRLDRTLSDYKGRDPVIYQSLGTMVTALADLFEAPNEPTPEALQEEARILRKSARTIAASYGGILGRRAFRALVTAASNRARDRGFIAA